MDALLEFEPRIADDDAFEPQVEFDEVTGRLLRVCFFTHLIHTSC